MAVGKNWKKPWHQVSFPRFLWWPSSSRCFWFHQGNWILPLLSIRVTFFKLFPFIHGFFLSFHSLLYSKPLDRLWGPPKLARHHPQPPSVLMVLRGTLLPLFCSFFFVLINPFLSFSGHLWMDVGLPALLRVVWIPAITACTSVRSCHAANFQIGIWQHGHDVFPTLDSHRGRFGLLFGSPQVSHYLPFSALTTCQKILLAGLPPV